MLTTGPFTPDNAWHNRLRLRLSLLPITVQLPSIGRKLLPRERCHLAGNPEYAVLRSLERGRRGKPSDAFGP